MRIIARKKAAVLAFFLCVILGYVLFADFYGRLQARSFFEKSLMDAGISESISLNGVLYRIRSGTAYTTDGLRAAKPVQGRALALAYEKTLAKRAPLFHLAGTNPADLETVADSLEASEQKLSEGQGTISAQQRIKSLFPVDFLRSVASLEKQRLLFLASGSDTDAQEYRKSLSRTVDTYKTDLINFSRNFKDTVPKTRAPFASGEIIVHRDTLLETAKLLLRQAEKARRLLSERLLCSKGSIAHCDTRDLSLPVIPITGRDPDVKKNNAHLYVVQNAKKEMGLLNTGEIRPIALEHSVCIPPGWDVPPYFGFPSEKIYFHGISYERPGLLGDTFFFLDKAHIDVPFFDALNTRGFKYVPAQPLAYYKCLELDEDLGALIAVRDTYTFASTATISKYAVGERKEILLALEKELKEQIESERNAIRYLNAANVLATDPAVPEEIQNTLIELSLELRDRSPGTYNTALDAAYLTETTLRLHTEGIPTDLSPGYLFYTRSGFPSLYMANNPSAIGQYKSLFTKNTIPRDEQPYVLLSDLISQFPTNPVLRKQVASDLKAWKSIHYYTN